MLRELTDSNLEYLTRSLLILSVVLNLTLGFVVHRQGIENGRLSEGLVQLKEDIHLGRGTLAGPISGVDADGLSLVIDLQEGSKPTLLYSFSETCGWCQRNARNIRFLAEEVSMTHQVIGLNLSAGPEGVRRVDDGELGFLSLSHLSEETIENLRLGSTPQTLVIGADGKVLENWTGAYSGSLEQKIEDYFRVTLPGLTDL